MLKHILKSKRRDESKWLKTFCICLILSQLFCYMVANDVGLTRAMYMHVENYTGMARTIDMQLNMEKIVVKKFEKLFQNYTRAVEVYTRKIIYICDNKCSSEFVHEYGLTSTFLLSVLSERKFVIKPIHAYSLYDFYEQHNYTWKLDMSEVLNKLGQMILPSSANQNRDLTELHLLESELHKMDFNHTFKQEFVTLSGNHNWIQDLRRHHRSIQTLPWLFKTHACDINRLVHLGLFRVPGYVRDKTNSQLLNKVGNNRLVCFHGKSKDKIKTTEVLNFILAKCHYSGYKIYISNFDSKAFFDNRYDIENDMNKEIVHFQFDEIYKLVKQEQQTPQNFKNFQNIIDVYILVMCDILVTMESPNGILAAHLRRNSDGLFCYREGRIFPCTRELIAGSFRDLEHAPVHLYP